MSIENNGTSFCTSEHWTGGSRKGGEDQTTWSEFGGANPDPVSEQCTEAPTKSIVNAILLVRALVSCVKKSQYCYRLGLKE
ncbi:hypothetical protein FOPE_08361 [Fonsecaea pedrosoi]|nr:hypothetical protein FOPE_08361 [Fonsecaea pedrosoi]